MQLDFEPCEALVPVNGQAADAARRPKPPKRLSPSGASTFEQCPRRWRFRYVDRLPDPPSDGALVGTFAHRVLELLMQRPPGQRTQGDARRIARAAWPEIADSEDFRALGLGEGEARAFRWKAWRAIEGLWDLEDPAAIEVLGTEQKVSVELGGVPFRGVVDRVESEPDGLVVSDYKSGRPPSARHAPARLRQVLLYSAAVTEQTGEQPVRARLLYLGQKIVGTPVTPKEIDGAVGQFTATWDDIAEACAADDFEARPGPLCRFCAYAPHCPEGQAETARRAAERAAEDEYLMRLAS